MLNFSRVAATFCVAVAVAVNWRTFGPMNKILAVLLLIQVLAMPTLIRLREKCSGKQVDKSVITETGYIWLILMAMVFSSHMP